jgi:RNA polymerase sigma factor (sigma-70 family)
MTALGDMPAMASRQGSSYFDREHPEAAGDSGANDLLTFVDKNFSQFLRRRCSVICACLGLGRHNAEDLCNDTLCQIAVRLHTRRPPLDCLDEWKRYLSRIATRLALNTRRATARQRAREMRYGQEREIRKHALAAKAPELTLIKEDIQRFLEESCDARTRHVFRLWSDGWTRSQIAKETKVCKSTVNRTLKRALTIIRPKLQSSGW